ncbi:MAG: long-chain fatty acid--CoA ligase [SAR324 cluster bacterium]|nr:long-chain fatty acid--CoA ligase [SAR324 cluster bacterium]
MLNLSSILENSARDYPEKTALVFMGKRMSYAQVNAMSNQVAQGLKAAGIVKGDRVALSCPNVPYFPIVYFAILKAGAVVVPLNVLLKAREIKYHLEDSQAKAYFCFEGTAELPMGKEGYSGYEESNCCKNFWMIMADPSALSTMEHVETLGTMMGKQSPHLTGSASSAEDTAVILYTSGTTGQAKGAELSHMNIMMNTILIGELFDARHEDIQLTVLPLFHTFGQTVQLLAGFYRGNTIVLIPRFDPETVLTAFEQENVTVFCGVPTMYWGLLNFPDAEKKFDLKKIASTLRLCGSGGAPIPVEILRGFEERFKVSILEGYGLSETSPVATFNRADRERKVGSVGQAIWGVEVKIVDKDEKTMPIDEIGEVVIRGHNVMKGYIGRPDATAEAIRDSWFHTGDMGKMDKEGYLYIVDRVKDMILRGGFNVYPREIEEVLASHPAISIAAVIGVPDESHGEEIKAFVILKEGAQATSEEIVEWSKKNMAGYKYPRSVEIHQSLPMTATGKILKRELKAAIGL